MFLDSGTLDLGTLDPWTLDQWTLDSGTLGVGLWENFTFPPLPLALPGNLIFLLFIFILLPAPLNVTFFFLPLLVCFFLLGSSTLITFPLPLSSRPCICCRGKMIFRVPLTHLPVPADL